MYLNGNLIGLLKLSMERNHVTMELCILAYRPVYRVHD